LDRAAVGVQHNFEHPVPFNLATTATNITTLVAAAVAFFTDVDWNTREGAFASATTSCAGNGSLAVTFRTKSVWHVTARDYRCIIDIPLCPGVWR
jgi:hypothetical protein